MMSTKPVQTKSDTVSGVSVAAFVRAYGFALACAGLMWASFAVWAQVFSQQSETVQIVSLIVMGVALVVGALGAVIVLDGAE